MNTTTKSMESSGDSGPLADDFNGFWRVAALMKPEFDNAINDARIGEWRRVLGLVSEWVQSDANLSGEQLLSLAEAIGVYTSFLLGKDDAG